MICMMFVKLLLTRTFICILTRFLYANKQKFDHVFTPAIMMARLGVIPSNIQGLPVFFKTVSQRLRGTASTGRSQRFPNILGSTSCRLLYPSPGIDEFTVKAFQNNSSSILHYFEELFFHKRLNLIELILSTI